jgi:ABC-type bacteriocin/lantibiotic exporter with double-glycine peptidase domain
MQAFRVGPCPTIADWPTLPQTGALTSSLADNAQKISGLAGTTLGTIIQSLATIVAGAIIGLIYGWKLSLIGIACIPLIICAGYIRLRLVVLKDQNNKADHEESAQCVLSACILYPWRERLTLCILGSTT